MFGEHVKLKENLYVVVRGNVPQEKVEVIVTEILRCYDKLGNKPDFCEVLIFRGKYEVDRFIEEENELIYSRLGIRVSGIAPDSSVTHFAWRGWPTITVCVNEMERRPWKVALAELRRAVAHSILHGLPKYYLISFPETWFELRNKGLIRSYILETAFYVLTTAVKSFEVTRFLVKRGFIECQKELYQYHLKIKPEEKEMWQKASSEVNFLLLMLMDVFKVLSGATPLISYVKDPILTDLYEENLKLVPETLRRPLRKLFNEMCKFGEDTLENIFTVANEIYELLSDLF